MIRDLERGVCRLVRFVILSRTPKISPGRCENMRCQPVFMVAGLPVPQYSLTMRTGWYPSRSIRFVTPMRHLHPCELAPLDALLGGGFPCCALSPLFPVALSGLPMHIDCDSLGCSSRRPAIAFTNRCGRPAVYRGP